jgi:hypothetical protein
LTCPQFGELIRLMVVFELLSKCLHQHRRQHLRNRFQILRSQFQLPFEPMQQELSLLVLQILIPFVTIMVVEFS